MAEAEMEEIPRYRRDVLIETLTYHWATRTSGCGCGWAVLGASHPAHVANVYEASVAARQPEKTDSPVEPDGES